MTNNFHDYKKSRQKRMTLDDIDKPTKNHIEIIYGATITIMQYGHSTGFHEKKNHKNISENSIIQQEEADRLMNSTIENDKKDIDKTQETSSTS